VKWPAKQHPASSKKKATIVVVTYDTLKRLDGLPSKDARKYVRRLKESAGVVIADEAHCIRNTKTEVYRVMSSFRTSRRVALTGHPLMNNLDEYYTMIDWACPGFFLDKGAFDKEYKEPIEAGRKANATAKVRNRMLKQATLLSEMLRSILHRVSPTRLFASLPPKLEILISLRLPLPQLKLYLLAVKHVRAQQPPNFLVRSRDFKCDDVTALTISSLCECFCGEQEYLDCSIQYRGHRICAVEGG
jgi:SNF2 family DNA or RNA helicase